jgi:hypothetical protein
MGFTGQYTFCHQFDYPVGIPDFLIDRNFSKHHCIGSVAERSGGSDQLTLPKPLNLSTSKPLNLSTSKPLHP